MQPPKSLTAIVHMKFHYKEAPAKPLEEGEIEIISKILDKAAELAPEMQETLARFAEYLSRVGEEREDGQGPNQK